ncbi:MAG: ATP synthase F1 subunit delta [Candidatus Magasanikbacteria bacterium]|nr:ATP synthase F1 subunit delta [Candidatus Magasanikbacteria bacterium]
MSKISNRQYARALYEVSLEMEQKNMEITELITAFLAVLKKDHKIKQVDNIIKEFIKIEKEQSGVKDIEITASDELDKKTVEVIKKAFGDKVEETLVVDKTILGGVKVKLGDKIFDASLRTQLERLKYVLYFNN